MKDTRCGFRSRLVTNRLQALSLHGSSTSSLGATFYEAESRTLKVLEDTKDTWAWDLAVLCEFRGLVSTDTQCWSSIDLRKSSSAPAPRTS